MWRLKIGLLIGGGALGWFGVQDVMTAARNTSAESMSCDAYAQARPDAEWLELTECVMRPDGMAIETDESDRITRVYVPLLGLGMLAPADGGAARTPIALVSEDPELLALVSRMEGGDEAAAHELTRLYMVPRSYHGLVQAGMRLDDRAHSELSGLSSESLEPSFIVLEDGEEPSFLSGIAKLAGSALAFAVGGLLLFRRRA